MSVIRTAERSKNQLENGYKLRKAGILRQPIYPFCPGVTTGVASATSATVPWPSDHVINDLGILIIQSSGGDSTPSISGWTHFAGSPVVDIADATGSKLSVMWRWATSSAMESVTVPDQGDHVLAGMVGYRYVSTDVIPGRAIATSTKTTASTTVTWPAITTVSPFNEILFIATRPSDSASTTTFSGFTNANVSGPVEFFEAGTTVGNGGGFVVYAARRADIGDIGTSTATSSSSETNAVITISLEPTLALPA